MEHSPGETGPPPPWRGGPSFDLDPHIAASAPFKGVSLNSSYSRGIDDQDLD